MKKKTYTRNMVEGMDYPYISFMSDFEHDKHFVNLLWNLENLFVNTYEREAISVDAYTVEGDLVIIADNLLPFDHHHLEKATDYTTYEMPNGQILVDYYEDHITNIHEYMDSLDNVNKTGYVTRRQGINLIDPIETKVSFRYEKMYVGVRCYDVNDEPIVSGTGTVDIAGVGIGGIEEAIGSIDATSASPVLLVDRPYERIKATPNTLSSDVDHWQLVIWQI